MTSKQKTRVQILSNQFLIANKSKNPYIKGAEIWRKWYNAHLYNEPIPKDKLPTEEELREFDKLQDIYIAEHLLNYETLIAFGESVLGKPTEKAVWNVIARTRPCRCEEAQCSFFCKYYGTENCYGEENL